MTVDKEFLWGGATAAYQCEGAWDADGKVSSNWDWWLHERGLPNADVASDHYHHVLEDIALAKEGGHTAYRFSLSWPRIIKDREGTVNDACAEAGIEPFVTVFHWDLPVYWEELGGWTNTQTALAFEHYARVCYEAFGDRVRSWVTINEPKWFTSRGYLVGDYPPFHQNAQEYIQAGFNIMLASALGVKAVSRAPSASSTAIRPCTASTIRSSLRSRYVTPTTSTTTGYWIPRCLANFPSIWSRSFPARTTCRA